MKRFSHVRHISGALFLFIVGWVAFGEFSFRIGYHPYSLRIQGATIALQRVTESCYTGNDADRTKFMLCVQRKLVSGVRRWGMREFMLALEQRQIQLSSSTRSITQCHDLAHAIGWAGVIAAGDIHTLLPQCTSTCVSGCQHGAISAWFAMGKDFVSNLPTMCVEGFDWSKSPEGQGGCFHELGHAVANIAGYDITKSLSFCDQVDSRGRVDCGHGVFMEMYEPATFIDVPRPLPDNHPAWCSNLWEPYKAICFNQAGANVFGRTMNDEASYAVCHKVPIQFRQGCFRNLGQNIFYVYQYEKDLAASIEEFCARAGREWFSPCISGAIASSVASEPKITGGIGLCKQLVGEGQRTCYASLGGIVEAKRGMGEKMSICTGLSSQNLASCRDTHDDPFK